MKYILQMNGSVSQLRWTYEFEADDDQDAVETARRFLTGDHAARSAHYVALWADKTMIHKFSFTDPTLVGEKVRP